MTIAGQERGRDRETEQPEYAHTLCVRENGAASGVGVLATFAYDDMGHRTGLTRGNGTSDAYAYDASARLQSLTLSAGAAGNAYTYAYNPAGQMVSRAIVRDKNVGGNRTTKQPEYAHTLCGGPRGVSSCSAMAQPHLRVYVSDKKCVWLTGGQRESNGARAPLG